MVGVSLSLGLVAAPVALVLDRYGVFDIGGQVHLDIPFLPPIIALPLAFVLGIVLAFVLGIVLAFALLYVARGIASLHGAIAKSLLVKSAQY